MTDSRAGRATPQTTRTTRTGATAKTPATPTSTTAKATTAKATTTRPSATAAPTATTTGGATASAPSPIGPADAVARHIEWLDFALAAARSEETWRRERLAKATKRNRVKREERLEDVSAEIGELSALLAGIRELTARRTRAATAKPRAKGRTTRRKPTAGSATRARAAKATPPTSPG